MRFLPAILLCGTALAQTKEPAPVIGVLNFIHAVSSLERSIEFYTEVFGLAKPAPPRPPNAAVPALINAPGALLRVAVFRLPGAAFGLEVTDFGGVERKPAQPLHTDPGAANIVIRVRELEPVLAAIRKAGVPVITRSGAPVKLRPEMSSIMFRDPDGYIIIAMQAPPPEGAPATGNVLGASMGITVTDMDETLKFYRDILGFELTGRKEFGTSDALADLVGAPKGTQSRALAGNVPGTTARIEFHEYKGMPRTPFHLRIPDPGAPAVAFRVTDLDGLVTKMKAAGVKVVSAGGVPAQFSPAIRNIFVEDPSGFKIELYQSAQ